MTLCSSAFVFVLPYNNTRAFISFHTSSLPARIILPSTISTYRHSLAYTPTYAHVHTHNSQLDAVAFYRPSLNDKHDASRKKGTFSAIALSPL